MLSRNCSAAAARDSGLGSLSALTMAPRCTISLKKVWSLDHHWSMLAGRRAMETISCCMRSTHDWQTAIPPGDERSMSMPVFISWPMPHSCWSLSAPPCVTSVLTMTSG